MCSLRENKFWGCPHIGGHHKAKNCWCPDILILGHQWIDAPGTDQNSTLLTLTHISLLLVTTVRKPVVVPGNDNTVVAGCSTWITAPPVAVLHVNWTSVYIYMLTDLRTTCHTYMATRCTHVYRITIYWKMIISSSKRSTCSSTNRLALHVFHILTGTMPTKCSKLNS